MFLRTTFYRSKFFKTRGFGRHCLRQWACLIATAVVLTGCGQAGESSSQAAGMQVNNARVMMPLPGKTLTSGYFDLHNGFDKPMQLVAVRSPAVRAIEMHELIKKGDQVRMHRLTQIDIAPASTVSLAPGNTHLMLFGAEDLPTTLPLTLEFADGTQTTATFALQRW